MKKDQPNNVNSGERASDQKLLRQMAVTTSKAKWDDLGMKMRQMDETRQSIRDSKDGMVQEREPEKDPILLRPILALLTLGALVSGCVAVFYALRGVLVWQIWAVLAVCAGLRGAYAYWKYRKEQQAWIDRMSH